MTSAVRVRFTLDHQVPFGFKVAVCGNTKSLGNWDAGSALELTCIKDRIWVGEAEVEKNEISYKYLAKNPATGEVMWEGENFKNRTLDLTVGSFPSSKVYQVNQIWNPPESTSDKIFQSSAFQEVLFRRPNPTVAQAPPTEPDRILVKLSVYAWRVHPNDELAVVGSIPELGSWHAEGALSMHDSEFPVWNVYFYVAKSSFPFTYKYIVRKQDGGVIWETGNNRNFNLDSYAQGKAAAVETQDDIFHYHGRDHLDWRGAGVVIPIFSLKTHESLGVGEFTDLKAMVDLCKKSGLHLIQILPINDTSVSQTWKDSYPYSSLSVIALHPIYLNVGRVARNMPDVLRRIEQLRGDLDIEAGKQDYEDLLREKLGMMRDIFDAKKKELLKDSSALDKFVEENKAWLKPYAAFCVLRDKKGTSDHFSWDTYSNPTPEDIEELTSPESECYHDVLFWYFVQYHLDNQLRDATTYAAENGVVIKGDLPIGVDPKSVDTWTYPDLFRLDTQTGAPPDYFSENGQNWGFPTYNWDEMSKHGYKWWRQRLHQLDKYFHAIRIDHVLGLFRIWEIPIHALTGIMGHFRPSHPIWRSELESAGIWDIDRLCRPECHWDLMYGMFGEDIHDVIGKFFDDMGHGFFHFKDRYSTERAVDEATKEMPDHIRNGLMWLLTNKCLHRDEDEPHNKFYPRFECFKLPAYLALPDSWKTTLKRLHDSYYYERQEDLWSHIGRNRLGVFRHFSRMLICAEDLGMVPDCVPPVLHELGILCLRIQRMPKDTKIEFDSSSNYPFLSVCSPSSHDTTTTRQWWEDDRERSQRFYNHIGLQGPAPFFFEPYVAERVVEDHLFSASMWAIFPIQEFFAMEESVRRQNPHEEQINNPAVRYHHWKYRIHIPLEDLAKNEQFTSKIRRMVEASGRTSYY